MKVYDTVSANKRKTWFIMVLFVLFITTLTYVYVQASEIGLIYAGIALVIAGITSFGSYFASDSIVLATTGAKHVSSEQSPDLYRIVENLSIGSGLPMPKVYLIDDPSPNAFATGRDPKHASVAFTTGLLRILSKTELEGVVAHELSHIKNFDTRLMVITAILVGFVAILADIFMRSLWFGGRGRSNKAGGMFAILGIVLALLSPLVASLIQLAVSRKREFLADASGVLLTRYPEGLAAALEKIARDPLPLRTASNATAHLFIENPFKNKSSGAWFSSLFNTHPPAEDRIKLLRSM